MSKTSTIAALMNVLHASFDETYLKLLEDGKVSLDDELQHRLRGIVVPEVYGVMSEECARMGKTAIAMHDHFCEHGPREVARRLLLELQEEETAPIGQSGSVEARIVLLPALEPAKG